MELVTTYLPWAQIVLAVTMTALILLQQSDASLGSAFGGSMSESISRTRRGSEKYIFFATIIIGVLFIASTILALFVVGQ
jgi:protein translocase SecG subunit